MGAWALERTAYPAGWLSATIGAAGLGLLSIVLLIGGLAIAAIFPILALLIISTWFVTTQVPFTKVRFRERDMVVHRLFKPPIIVVYKDLIEIRRTFVKNFSGGGTGYAVLIRFRQGSGRPRRMLPGIDSIPWADALIEHIRSQQVGPHPQAGEGGGVQLRRGR